MTRSDEHPRSALPILFLLTLMGLAMLSVTWTEGEAQRQPMTNTGAD
jgi:hypothetical protein